MFGSCLSYGHSCWGAHGKRSGAGTSTGVNIGSPEAQWFISRLAPRQQLETQWIPRGTQDTDQQRSPPQEIRRSSGVNIGEASLFLPADSDLPDEILGTEEKQVIIMEQPPRLLKILNHLPSKLERK